MKSEQIWRWRKRRVLKETTPEFGIPLPQIRPVTLVVSGYFLSRNYIFYIGYIDLSSFLCYTILLEDSIMHVKVITSKGVPRLYIYETYYDKDPATGKKRIRSKMIESLGRLDELKKLYDDPVAHFKEVCQLRTSDQKQAQTLNLQIDLTSRIGLREDNLKNVGYGIFKELYKQLELDRFWNWKTRDLSIDYSVDQIFRLLVFSRILYPGSKKKAFDRRSVFFEDFKGFSLDDIYYSLDLIAKNQQALQKWIFDHSEKLCKRDLSVTYFDCTNYYFDIGRPDVDLLDENGRPVDRNGEKTSAKYRKRGPEKNHRPDPIVEMGLLMDRNGIPLAYDLFPGNESEKVHMRPIVNRLKQEYSHTRTIFVADRGLNTSDNIYWINGDNKEDHNPRDGYLYGQSVRGADAEFKDWVTSGGYRIRELLDDDGNPVKFIHKSRIQVKELHINVLKPGSKKPSKKTVRVDQKQMAYYSEKYAKKQKADREAMIARAKDLILHPKKYDRVTSAGSAAFVKNIAFDKTTGEIVDGLALELDEEKIREQERFDGYYSIVTSELDMTDLQMRELYRGLARIEETFKISKSDFRSRPVYVSTNEHIDAHFSTCFTALVLIRLLQTKLGHKYPVGRILESLRKYNCTKIDTNIYQFLYFDEITQSCGEAFHKELNNKYRTQQQIRRLLRY